MTHNSEHNLTEDLVGYALKLDGIIDYHKDEIVSKSLVSSKKGTVTVYAVDKGQRLSEHTARSHATVYILHGEAQVEYAGEEFILRKGDAIVLPAGEPHALRAVKRFKMLLSLVRA
jgi:quercetin dioxygenase-like cupin family protein